MSKYSKQPIDYNHRLKFIRRFTRGFGVSDGYDLRQLKGFSSAKKAQINRYYNSLIGLTSRSHYIYRPRKKTHLESVRSAMGVSQLKKLKVGILQVPTQLDAKGKRQLIKPKVTIKKDGSLNVKVKGINRQSLLFSDYGITRQDLIIDPMGAVETVLDQTDFTQYSIIAGEYEIGKGVPTFFRKQTVKKKIQKLLMEYSAENFDPNNKNSSYYANWLEGFVGYQFNSVKDTESYALSMIEHKRKKDKLLKKIKSSKSYIERINQDIIAINRSKLLTPKQKDNKVRSKRRLIDKQNKRIDGLILRRLKL